MYLAIDLGTTGCRSIIFDSKLKEISSSYEEYPLTIKGTFIEQNAELWWELTLKTSKEAIKNANISPCCIDGISISSQGISVVPVDKNCKPLCGAISWLDTRAEKEAERIKNDFGETKILKITGKPCNSVYTLPKILWIKNNMPQIYKNTYKFLMPLDFLTAKLTGNFITDHSMASGTLMYDVYNACWCDEILDKYDIEIKKLPKLAYTGEFAGYVLPQIREKLGLKENCIVAVGAQDQKCAAYGVGISADSVTVSLGTAAAVTVLCNEAKGVTAKNITLCGYVEPDTLVSEGVLNTAGTCLRWLRDTIYNGEKYSVIDKEAKTASQNSLIFVPYMSDGGGMFSGLALSTKRCDFARAVMEGVAFEIRALLDAMESYGKKQKIILFGGGARSDVWCQIICDVTGMDILVPSTEEAAGAGAARAAARTAGKITEPLLCDRIYKPGKNYDEKYKRYISLINGEIK
ncbi:MAG: hypothetical protein IJT23_11085 [Clostridia bacterium]|nr:hypothetical protein [Clostridia bacterium]